MASTYSDFGRNIQNGARNTYNPRYVSDFYSRGLQNFPQTAQTLGFIYLFTLILLITLILSIVIWSIWYRPSGVTLGGFIILIMKSIVNTLLWPIKFLLKILGFLVEEEEEIEIELPIIQAPSPTTHTEIIKHEITDCPACTNECNCPTCEETDIRPYELEIKYLKNMVKLTGSIARRENAINSQYRELYPGFSIVTPHVRKITHEYNFIKDEMRKDAQQWQYFKNYFSRISGIPSSSQPVHYDLVL